MAGGIEGERPPQEPTPQPAREPDQIQTPLEAEQGASGTPVYETEPSQPQEESGEGNPVISLSEYKTKQLIKRGDELFESLPPAMKKLWNPDKPHRRVKPVVYGNWFILTPEKVDRMLKRGIVTEEEAEEMRQRAVRLREEILFRQDLISLRRSGQITRKEFNQRLKEFLASQK